MNPALLAKATSFVLQMGEVSEYQRRYVTLGVSFVHAPHSKHTHTINKLSPSFHTFECGVSTRAISHVGTRGSCEQTYYDLFFTFNLFARRH